MQTTLDILVGGLADQGVSVMLIGGYALPAYGVVRQTVDVDCLMTNTGTRALAEVMESNGYVEKGRTESFVRYSHPSLYLMDLDVILVDSGTFEKMLQASNLYRIGSKEVRVPCVAHFIALKLHAIKNRPVREKRDILDILDLLDKNRDAVPPDELHDLCKQYGPEGVEAKLGDSL